MNLNGCGTVCLMLKQKHSHATVKGLAAEAKPHAVVELWHIFADTSLATAC